jgi:hypothetical protein
MQNERIKIQKEGNTMKRSTILLTALGVLLYLGAVPLFAQGHRGGGGTHGPTTTSRGNTDPSGGGKSTETSSQKQLNNVITSSTSGSPSKLAQKLMSMLPSTGPNAGLTLTAASAGFKNLGRFIAALHAYNNLGLATKTPPVSFTDFAAYDQGHSLGAAIKHYDPAADTRTETRNATKQANQDVKESES